jgi:S-adenosylmethionine:tRNA ribosyltransferase-isomerase
MKSEIFNFHIPEELIAQAPLETRSASRLLVYERSKDLITDTYFKNITEYLSENDFLVFNNSKVMPARLSVIKKSNGRQGEFLILKIIDGYRAEVIADKSKKYKESDEIILPENKSAFIEKNIDEMIKIIRCNEAIFTPQYLEINGRMPLPPYIRDGKDNESDKKRYQTYYAEVYGSAAAPTAGLHFDENIFNALAKKKIEYAYVSLHVGLGTFQPIYTENIENHKIHTEEYEILPDESEKIYDALKNKKRIIPVGTTSLRTLESAFDSEKNMIIPGLNKTSLYIFPGYNFKIAGGLITNFHTPKSSLAVLVAAMIGVEKLLEIYKHAVEKKYRFFSYGDAMLILP